MNIQVNQILDPTDVSLPGGNISVTVRDRDGFIWKCNHAGAEFEDDTDFVSGRVLGQVLVCDACGYWYDENTGYWEEGYER